MNVKTLRLYSLGYLILPNLIFFSFWMQPAIAVAGIVVLILALLFAIRTDDFNVATSFSGKDLIILVIFSLLLAFISGVSGLSYQTFDHWCHNTKFYELFKYDWPIRIPETGPVISYYYGYYVVPALIFKLIGNINEAVIFAWTFIGFFLGLSWVYIVLNKKIVYALLAMAIGDTPHVVKTVFYKFTHMWYQMGDFGVESWSNFENLLWVPNQVIPTMIVAGMFMYILKNRLKEEHIVFPVALIFWWAVFPAFTSGLLAAIVIFRKWILAKFQLDWAMTVKLVIVPFIMCVPVLIYLTSHAEAPISGFLWQFPDHLPSRFVEYVINIGLNLALFVICYHYFAGKQVSPMSRFPFYVILICFMLFPIYRVGKVNDFLFRGLMPYLLIIGIYIFYPFASESWSSSWRRIRTSFLHLTAFILLVSCSFIAIGRVARSLKVNVVTKNLFPDQIAFNPIPYDAYPNIYEVLKDLWSQREADQYLGKKDSIYELKMAPEKPSDN